MRERPFLAFFAFLRRLWLRVPEEGRSATLFASLRRPRLGAATLMLLATAKAFARQRRGRAAALAALPPDPAEAAGAPSGAGGGAG